MADTYYDPEKFVLLHVGLDGEPHPVKPIHCPIAVVLGHYEKLTDEELDDLRADVGAELDRRTAAIHRTEANDV